MGSEAEHQIMLLILEMNSDKHDGWVKQGAKRSLEHIRNRIDEALREYNNKGR